MAQNGDFNQLGRKENLRGPQIARCYIPRPALHNQNKMRSVIKMGKPCTPANVQWPLISAYLTPPHSTKSPRHPQLLATCKQAKESGFGAKDRQTRSARPHTRSSSTAYACGTDVVPQCCALSLCTTSHQFASTCRRARRANRVSYHL